MIVSQPALILSLLTTAIISSCCASSTDSPPSDSVCNDTDNQTCTAATATANASSSVSVSDNDQPFCGVYMAPSTIGVANMGIFTNIDLHKGDVINFPEIAIPLLFRDWHDHGDNPDGTLWDRYIWDGPVVNMEPKRSDLNRIDAGAVFIPGVGCTVNSRLEMNNIYSTHGGTYDTAGLHRATDPGAGAFSPYHSARTTAKMDIQAGNELFASYGDTWIPFIPGAVITFNENMDQADEFLDEYAQWVKENKKDGGLTSDMAEDLWKLTAKDFPISSRILGALPHQHDWKTVEAELEKKTEPSTTRHFVKKIGVRTPEWLKEHGFCQDHIRPGRSTIAQAGRGAFANRPLPKGTVVGYSPLVHIGNAREILQINYTRTNGTTYTQEDMIINYSFGHKNSTLILTPYGAMVNYINHHRTLANVKVQWPKKELIAHKPSWLLKSVEFLSNTHEKIGLSFDYVALRDLEQGEELFMDYGDEWIAAWEEHVNTWTPGSKSYQHVSAWTESHFRTRDEVYTNPYPENLATLCIPSYKSNGNGGYTFVPILRKGDGRVYCDVIIRQADNEASTASFKYTVIMHMGSGPVTVENVTNEGIQLVDRVRSADWHLEGAFRHEIAIPDDLFPDTWKNLMS